MKLYLLRKSRWSLKLFILVPLVVVVLLNVRLVNHQEFTSLDDSELVANQNIKHLNPVIIKTLRNLSASLVNFKLNLSATKNHTLKLFIDKSNLNPIVRNKHFIQRLLDEEKLQHEENSLLTTTTTTTTTSTTTKAARQNRRKNKQGAAVAPGKVYKAPKFLVILIQVHSRLNYLKELIESLRLTEHIKDTLVVFSHDIFDPSMNELIETIDFCATLQIFYPFSLQLYPDTFPGRDPNDCPKSIGKKGAILAKCNNAYFPDAYGNFREHTIVQIKHHWFWKLGYVFEQLNETRELPNLQVLLLEEDYYLMPDSIHVLRKLSEKILSDIDVVSLAVFDKMKQNLDMKNFHKYGKAIWHSSSHNTGLMLGRAQWNMIKDCLNAFCTYDDYNWDWTLQYISQTCFKLPLVSIYPELSRVIHIGECGTHHKGKNCDPKTRVDALKQMYAKNDKSYFPAKFELNKVNTQIRALKKSNGGWSDQRDHLLCKSFASPQIQSNNITLFI